MRIEYQISSLFVLAVIFVSCCKDQPEAVMQNTIYPAQDWGFGFAHAKKNGLSFEAGGWVNLPQCSDGTKLVQITLLTEDNLGYTKEELPLITAEFSQIPGIFTLPISLCGVYPFMGTGYSLLNTEMLEDNYILDYTTNNWVRIDVADTLNNTLRGSFHLKFVIDPQREKMNKGNPDTVEFTEGIFELTFY